MMKQTLLGRNRERRIGHRSPPLTGCGNVRPRSPPAGDHFFWSGEPVQLGQPDVGAAVGRRPPVAARRQRAARRDLGPVGQRRALELVGEEAPQEQFQPVPDLGQRIGAPRAGRQVGRPGALLDVVPGIPGEEGDLGRPVAEPRQVEEIEVLQRIGTDRLLGRLDGAACRRPGSAPARFRCRGCRAGSRPSPCRRRPRRRRSGSGAGSASWRPSRWDCSATCDRRRRRCTSPAPARRDRRCRPPCRDAGWPGGTGSRCAGPPARSRR